MWDVERGTQGRGDMWMQGRGDVGREHTQGLEDKGHRDWRT